MAQCFVDSNVFTPFVEHRHQLSFVVVVFCQRWIGVIGGCAGSHVLNGVGWFLKKEGRFACWVRTHFACMGGVVSADAINTAHWKHLVRAHDGNVNTGHFEGRGRRAIGKPWGGTSHQCAGRYEGGILKKFATVHGVSPKKRSLSFAGKARYLFVVV